MTPSQTADDTYFQRRYHDYVVTSLAFGSDIDVGLISPSGRAVILRLEDAVAFRAKGVTERNIVIAVSFEPLRSLTPEAFIATLRKFGDPFDRDQQLRALLEMRRDFGLLSIDEAVGLSAVAVCRRAVER